ncbi:uncharacterized protein Pyn_10230 [Prunus yedoensis var. nudiflora]|uniref:Transposase Tnp1/En/Spm-like domain-containing protein n=1 Tax=Prunus yedoensis var. nudiflora TaxID=2094558 RepID=A0A314UQQ3_PRUYE|nr:uncharacterized protein Pyn_10230 [Prunus yedoensis var. nudiflora]
MDHANETDVKFNNKRTRGVTKKPQIAKNRSRGIKEIKDELGSSDDDELDRSELWKRARQMTNGLFDPATQAIVDKIDELTKQSKLGLLDKIVGDQDILTQSLGTPEHCGRVRGVGKFVTPTNYFHTPQAPVDWNKREKIYCQRLAALEETVKALSQQQPPTPHSDVSSNNVRNKVVYNAQVKETFAAAVEKKVDKDQTCQLALVSKDNVVATGTILESGTPNVLVVIEVVLDPDALLPFQIDECLVNVKDGVGHHVLWPKEFVLHTVPKGEKGKADIEKVPLSHKDEKTLKKGPNKVEKTPFTDNSLLEIQKTLPKIRTTLPKILKTSPNIKQTSPKMESSKPIQTPITNVKRPLKNPDSIEVFMKFAMRGVTKDSTFQVNFDDDTFGYHFYIFLTKEDLTCLTSMLELTVSCIILYMRQLYDHMKDEGLLQMFGFINPAIVSLAGNLNNQRKRDERSRNVADRLVKAKKNQLIIMPYNPA